ncbi:MAG: hypothetical protein RL208_769 [Pseudomonadota bacterium]|jgi:hypothetical protein
MHTKHKIVLSISQELQIPLQKIQKYVYWYKLHSGINYHFVNNFSFELENDIKTLISKDHLNKKRYALELEVKDKLAIQNLKNKIAEGANFTPPTLKYQQKQEQNTLFTIGYEGISIDEYINKLISNHIKTLVDVRKNAYSNKFGFSKKDFQYCLAKSNINYIHIPELGIESDKRQELKNAQNSNQNCNLFESGVKNIQNKLFEEYKHNLITKQKHIQQLLQILENDKLIAITCFEADHKCCHRHILAQSFNEIEVINL